MEDFKKRLLEFIEGHCKASVRAFERECGLTNGTIGTIGAKGPGADIVQKIAYTYPELNLNWLFRGTGEMILGEPQQEEKKAAPLADVHHNEQVNLTFFSELKSTIIDAMREVTREQFNQKEKAL